MCLDIEQMKRLRVFPKENHSYNPLIEEILEGVGDAKEPPSLPSKGIPDRWLPRWIGGLVKGAVLPFVFIDQMMQKCARKIIRPPYRREGSCRKRGNCCYYILIRAEESFSAKLFFLWYTQVHGFYKRMKQPQSYQGKKVWVMGCRYLHRDGTCKQYKLRPSVCREWPRIESFGEPRVLKGCGFSAQPRYLTLPTKVKEK